MNVRPSDSKASRSARSLIAPRGAPFAREAGVPSPQDPHDALFRAAFQSASHAAALLCALFPSDLCELVDWDSLARDAETFVESSLHKRVGDLVFRARLVGAEHILVVPLEHQSTVERRFPLRGTRYIVGAWERHDHDAPGTPLPFPVLVLVSNAAGGWTAPRSLAALLPDVIVAAPSLAALIPQFPMLVLDLAATTDAELDAMQLPSFPTLVLWALRDGRDKQRILAGLPRWGPRLVELARSADGRFAAEQLFSYFAAVTRELTIGELRDRLSEIRIPGGEAIMTIAEDYQNRGRLQILRKQLVVKFEAIPADLDARLVAASAEELEDFAERVLTADTIEAVFDDAH